jgi:hypothetical protein
MAKMTKHATAPTHEAIAQRAHEIYEQSGRIPGRDIENWLRAKAELSSPRGQEANVKEAPVAAIAKAAIPPVPKAVARPAMRR